MREGSRAPLRLLEGWLAGWGLTLPEERLALLVRLAEDVAAEAERWAITGVRGTEENLRRNVVDSLLALAAPEWAGGGEALDLGSGAGFPGLALALAEAGRSWWLLEATRKKAAFLAREAEALGVGGRVQAVWGRAEDRRTWLALGEAPPWPAGFARVTARAVAPLQRLIPICAGLLERPGGLLFAYKGPAGRVELAGAQALLRRERLALVRVVEARLPEGGESRLLLVFRAEA
ncbi:MAG: 16S rRNA (guanine(527)-N(7))-methyltransferase RsmG [Bacillota bacterium]|nr:16S rRNA (guanine(527)-N(7))-methyltransferase RsmG [Bacillota bacterium]